MKKIYTYEYCENFVKDFTTLEEITNINKSIVTVIRRNGWNELLSHLKRKKHKKYTINECIEKVSKYEYLNDFVNENLSMYTVIRNNKWNNILEKLKKTGSKYKRCIYAYEFVINEKKYSYIGLTFNLKMRDLQHRKDKKSVVYIFSKNNNISIPSPKQLTDYVIKEEASKLETEYVKIYKENGWIILNIAKTGTLGGNPYGNVYTKENCIEIAKKYNTIKSFADSNSRAYQIIRKNNWQEEVFSHMKKRDFTDTSFNKQVGQYSIDGDLIKIYKSIGEASRSLNIRREHISHCCNQKRKTCGGYIWKFVKSII